LRGTSKLRERRKTWATKRFVRLLSGIGPRLRAAGRTPSTRFTLKDVIVDYPQSGERIRGRDNIRALRSHHPGKPSSFAVRQIQGSGDLWVSEYVITYLGTPSYSVSIMEFKDGKVIHETQYFADPFAAPSWRAQWVEKMN
jgi:hypothetical protein